MQTLVHVFVTQNQYLWNEKRKEHEEFLTLRPLHPNSCGQKFLKVN